MPSHAPHPTAAPVPVRVPAGQVQLCTVPVEFHSGIFVALFIIAALGVLFNTFLLAAVSRPSAISSPSRSRSRSISRHPAASSSQSQSHSHSLSLPLSPAAPPAAAPAAAAAEQTGLRRQGKIIDSGSPNAAAALQTEPSTSQSSHAIPPSQRSGNRLLVGNLVALCLIFSCVLVLLSFMALYDGTFTVYGWQLRRLSGFFSQFHNVAVSASVLSFAISRWRVVVYDTADPSVAAATRWIASIWAASLLIVLPPLVLFDQYVTPTMTGTYALPFTKSSAARVPQPNIFIPQYCWPNLNGSDPNGPPVPIPSANPLFFISLIGPVITCIIPVLLIGIFVHIHATLRRKEQDLRQALAPSASAASPPSEVSQTYTADNQDQPPATFAQEQVSQPPTPILHGSTWNQSPDANDDAETVIEMLPIQNTKRVQFNVPPSDIGSTLFPDAAIIQSQRGLFQRGVTGIVITFAMCFIFIISSFDERLLGPVSIPWSVHAAGFLIYSLTTLAYPLLIVYTYPRLGQSVLEIIWGPKGRTGRRQSRSRRSRSRSTSQRIFFADSNQHNNNNNSNSNNNNYYNYNPNHKLTHKDQPQEDDHQDNIDAVTTLRSGVIVDDLQDWWMKYGNKDPDFKSPPQALSQSRQWQQQQQQQQQRGTVVRSIGVEFPIDATSDMRELDTRNHSHDTGTNKHE